MPSDDTMPNSPAVSGSSRVTAAFSAIIGIWLFISPWVYGAAHNPDAWNNWIVGFLITLFALIRYSNPFRAASLGWANMVLAIWVFISPWIFRYTGNTDRFVNSLCVGIVVFVLAVYGASSIRRPLTNTPIRH